MAETAIAGEFLDVGDRFGKRPERPEGQDRGELFPRERIQRSDSLAPNQKEAGAFGNGKPGGGRDL